MKTQELQKKLQMMFAEKLCDLFTNKAYNDYNYNSEEAKDFCRDYADSVSESLTRDCIRLINNKDWDIPKNNFYPFGFAMKSEYNITDKVQLLNRCDAADIVSNWLWLCFGTYNLLYNFTTALTEFAEESNAI